MADMSANNWGLVVEKMMGMLQLDRCSSQFVITAR